MCHHFVTADIGVFLLRQNIKAEREWDQCKFYEAGYTFNDIQLRL